MASGPPAPPSRILITGASGFVGRHLMADLLASGCDNRPDAAFRGRIVATTHQLSDLPETPAAAELAGWNPKETVEGVITAPLDLTDAAATTELVARFRPDQIYHLAARASGADADRDAVMAANVGGTRNLLEAAAAIQPFPRVLLVSTGYVYGETLSSRPAREEDPIGPLWRFGPYTDSKIEMETVGRAYRGLAITARAFAHAGPGQAPNFAIPSFARQLARIEAGLEPPELSVGNLEALRDMLDVRDVVRAYRLLMTYAAPGDVANVAIGRPLSMQAILDALIARSAVGVTLKTDPARLRPADIHCSCGDPALLHGLTGWTPQYRLKETLDATLSYWREQVKLETEPE